MTTDFFPFYVMATIMCLSPCSCKGQKVDNSTVGSLDLGRYLGTWYEIARFDHSFERGMNHTQAHYSLNRDGTITVRNTGYKNGKNKESVGKAKLTETPGLFRVSFFGPFYSDYRVMMLSEDYNHVLVGSGKSKYLWILSRMPVVPDEIIGRILEEATDRGYDVGRLIWVDHTQN